MTEIKAKRRITTEQVTRIVCDVCGAAGEPRAEGAEYLRYKDTGGYFGKFDMCRKEIDMCEQCVVKILGKWLRVSYNGERLSEQEVLDMAAR